MLPMHALDLCKHCQQRAGWATLLRMLPDACHCGAPGDLNDEEGLKIFEV